MGRGFADALSLTRSFLCSRQNVGLQITQSQPAGLDGITSMDISSAPETMAKGHQGQIIFSKATMTGPLYLMPSPKDGQN